MNISCFIFLVQVDNFEIAKSETKRSNSILFLTMYLLRL